jgi:hypothetical protein
MSTSDERAEGAYLPQAAKVEMPEVRQRSDAAAELKNAGQLSDASFRERG